MKTAAPQRRAPGPDARLRTVLGALALLLALPIVTWAYCWLAERPVSSVRLAGMVVPRNRPLREFLEERASLWERESVTIETGFHVWRPSHAELGAHLPVDEAEREIRSLTRSANPMIALRAFWKGNFGRGHELRWRPRIDDQAALDAYAQRIRQAVDRLPVAGSFDPSGRPIAGIAGEALDVEALKRAIRSGIARGAASVKVPTLVTPAPSSFRRFESPSAATDVLMMAQETDYRPRSGRAINIELAARSIDGKVIMPGDGLSFNAVVGKRAAARGFAPATELVNGEVVEGVGGGVCQVAGTLHAAAFFAGLTVDEYRPHSRLNQFAYLRPGLDTMVAWPESVTDLTQTKDMRLRNPYPFPVRIKAMTIPKTAFQNTVRVELYGASRPFRVDWSFEEVGRVSPHEIERVDPSLRPGEKHVAQQGLEGIVIMRRRVIYMPTQAAREETRVAYPPTPTIVRVGPG